MLTAILLSAAIHCPQVWPCRIRHRDTHELIRRRDALTCFAQSTGESYPRPGWVVDHVQALACCGCDRPDNMQWQTVAEGRAKDLLERKGCSGEKACGFPES